MQPEPPAEPPPPQPAESDPAASQAVPAAPQPPPPAAPAAQAWPPVPAVASGPPRPGSVTAAGIVLIVFGVLIGLFGLLFILAGALFPAISDSPELVDQLGDVPDSFGAFILVVGFICAAWGTLQVVAAVFVMGRRTWARITAMILAILGALLGLATILPGESGLTPVGASLSLVFVAGHAFAIWALASQGRWFSAPG